MLKVIFFKLNLSKLSTYSNQTIQQLNLSNLNLLNI